MFQQKKRAAALFFLLLNVIERSKYKIKTVLLATLEV